MPLEWFKPPRRATTRQRGCPPRKVSMRNFFLDSAGLNLCCKPSIFLQRLGSLFDPGYRPTLQDILYSRFRTSGIRKMTFCLEELNMRMVDVGGQKSERRKWIHCFQDVTAILFIVSLSGYDQCLVEDRNAVRWWPLSITCADVHIQNQMRDALTIWDLIIHPQWFEKTSIVSIPDHQLPFLPLTLSCKDSLPQQERPFWEENSSISH
jgi:hypothetical protein